MKHQWPFTGMAPRAGFEPATIRLTVNEPPSAERKMAPRMGSAYGLKLKGVASIGFATPGRHVGEAVDRNSRTHKTMTSSRSARRARRRNT